MRKAKGSPTKRLFLDALIHDLDVVEAIEDLVDNSVDAAIKLKGAGQFTGLHTRIRFSPHEFKIEDNCGGMSVEIAENVAFRLGRPAGYTGVPGQIGEFGIGMKRDVFLLGKQIQVSSTTETSKFQIDISVDEWLERGETDWDFPFTAIEENAHFPKEQTGTTIVVTALNDEAISKFSDPNFHAELVDALQKKHNHAVERGMHIAVNGTPLTPKPYHLVVSDNIVPGHFALNLNGRGRTAVKLRIVSGIDEPQAKDAGWYVACNGRFILIADQTIKTGWGDTGTVVIPKMHGQFARFRGYAFFDSDDSSRLPWNSTKTGLNVESPVYRAARDVMIAATRPVIDVLNEIDKEIEMDDRPLTDALKQAKPKAVSAILAENTNVSRRNFRAAPAQARTDPNRPIRIAYSKPLRQVKEVRALLGTDLNREVGSKTFDYFYEHERR